MKKYRLEVENLKVQSLVTDVEVGGAQALFGPTPYTLTHPVIEPWFTDICIPSNETCNCVTHPWC